jgi:hypothetical protein
MSHSGSATFSIFTDPVSIRSEHFPPHDIGFARLTDELHGHLIPPLRLHIIPPHKRHPDDAKLSMMTGEDFGSAPRRARGLEPLSDIIGPLIERNRPDRNEKDGA